MDRNIHNDNYNNLKFRRLLIYFEHIFCKIFYGFNLSKITKTKNKGILPFEFRLATSHTQSIALTTKPNVNFQNKQ